MARRLVKLKAVTRAILVLILVNRVDWKLLADYGETILQRTVREVIEGPTRQFSIAFIKYLAKDEVREFVTCSIAWANVWEEPIIKKYSL